MVFHGSLLRRSAVLLGLVCIVSTAVGAVSIAVGASGWPLGAVVAVLHLLGLACYLALLDARLRRGALALLLLLVAISAISNWLTPFGGTTFAFVLPYVAPYVVVLSRVAVLVAIDAVATAAVLAGSGQVGEAAFGIAMGVLFSGAFATAVQQLIVARQQTDIAATARAGAAVLAERQRMAREIHDLLAHTLSAQVVQLEGARMLMERGDQPDKALRQVVGAVQLARDGLDETKRALSALRGDELRVVDRLAALAADFRATGLGSCELEAAAEPQLGSEARWAIVRSAQEALTNVRKHAVGADVVMRLGQSGEWCELEVLDSGGSRGELADTGAGFGLTGMRERAELIGGTVQAGRCGDGFRVRLRVPA